MDRFSEGGGENAQQQSRRFESYRDPRQSGANALFGKFFGGQRTLGGCGWVDDGRAQTSKVVDDIDTVFGERVDKVEGGVLAPEIYREEEAMR